MKKYTIIFAILVMISEVVCGQKEPKLLWEREVNTTDGKIFYSESRSSLNVTPIGNICAFTYGGTNIFDKDGNRLWGLSDFNQPVSASLRNTNINWVSTLDSAFIYDKNYTLLKKIPVSSNQKWFNIFEVEDGIIVGRNDSIIKYDFNIREIWKYKYREFSLMRRSFPYLFRSEVRNNFTLLNYNNLILDNKGMALFQFDSQSEYGVVQIDSTGFWTGNPNYLRSGNNYNAFVKEFNFVKYSFDGKKIVEINSRDINQNPDTEYYSTIFLQSGVFMATYFSKDKDEIFFTKVSLSGSKQTISRKLGNKLTNNFTIGLIKLLDENTVMFSINDTTGTYFGAAKFDDINFGSTKNVPKHYSAITGSNFRTFGINISELTYYNLDGTFKWKFKGDIFNTWDFKDGADYITQINAKNERFTSKIRTSDGKELWRRPYGEFLTDEKGNDYLRYYDRYGYFDNNFIEFIKKDGKSAVKFFKYKNGDISPYGGSGININFKEKTLITIPLESQGNNTYKFILRKYSTKDFYESVRCIDTLSPQIEAAGKTEGCPSVKVKLSDTKQDGISYQWQKDGKDLPNKTNEVYDFSESGNYTVVAKDSVCQNIVTSNVIKININSNPSAEIKATKNTLCEGEKVSINVISNSKFYQWQKDQKDIPDATKAFYEASQAGEYSVIVRDDKCPQVGYSNVFTINVKPTPEANITTDIKGVIYEPFTVKMTANTGTGLAYQWLKDDALIPNETTANYEAKKSGKYNVSVSKDGCTKISEALNISIQIALANEGEIGEDVVKIYPNPSRGEFKIVLPKSLQNADIQLFDILGREQTLIHTGEQVQADGLVQGTYFLRIQKGEKTVTSKLIIE